MVKLAKCMRFANYKLNGNFCLCKRHIFPTTALYSQITICITLFEFRVLHFYRKVCKRPPRRNYLIRELRIQFKQVFVIYLQKNGLKHVHAMFVLSYIKTSEKSFLKLLPFHLHFPILLFFVTIVFCRTHYTATYHKSIIAAMMGK